MTNEQHGFSTRAIHAGSEPDPRTGAVTPAIYQTSTYKQDGVGGFREGYEYSRSANPTRTALETCLAAIEGGSRGFAFASGLAASSTVLELLDAGRRNSCDVALVSHGAVIRLVAAFLGGVDPDWAYGAYLRNAQVITVEPGSPSSDAPAESDSAASNSAASDSAQQADDLLTKLRNTMSITSWGDHPLP